MNLRIKESEWKDFDDIKVTQDKAYWLKLPSGDIVMSMWTRSVNEAGWMQLFIDDKGELCFRNNHFYMAKDAKIQEVGEES